MATLSTSKLASISGVLLLLILAGFLIVRSRHGAILKDYQQLHVKSAEWQPGSGDLKSIELLGHSLSDLDVEKLRELGLKGSVTPAGSGTYGSGARDASVLIVMQRAIKEPTKLAQPDGTDIIYVQTDEGWRMYPAKAKTLQREIRLMPDPKQPNFATLYMVEHMDGSSQGGTLMTWHQDGKSP